MVGFIFSGHRPVRLWNAVFIEAVTVVKMTGVWSHPVHAPLGNIATEGDVGQRSAGLPGDLDKGKRRRSVHEMKLFGFYLLLVDCANRDTLMT